MTEQIQDQLSAFVDDELSSEECAFFVRRLQRDSVSADRVLRFATIGAALRGQLVQPDPGILLRRIDAALDGTAARTALVRRRAGGRVALWRPALGVGISAGVAALAVFLMRTVNLAAGDGEVGSEASARAVQAPQQQLDTPSYVVPRQHAATPMVSSQIQLTNYLMYHGEYTSGLGRTMVHSNVVVNVDDAIDLDETAAETERAEAPAVPEPVR